MKTEVTTMRDLAIELIDNKINKLECKMIALRKARVFIQELKIDQMAIPREEAAEAIINIIKGGYFD